MGKVFTACGLVLLFGLILSVLPAVSPVCAAPAEERAVRDQESPARVSRPERDRERVEEFVFGGGAEGRAGEALREDATAPDGDFVPEAYRAVVARRIQPFFAVPPGACGRLFELKIVLEIAETGLILGARPVGSSGDPDFDAAALRAVREAGRVAPPPGNAPLRLPLLFSSDISCSD